MTSNKRKDLQKVIASLRTVPDGPWGQRGEVINERNNSKLDDTSPADLIPSTNSRIPPGTVLKTREIKGYTLELRQNSYWHVVNGPTKIDSSFTDLSAFQKYLEENKL